MVWYEESEPGAAIKFFAALERTYQKIALAPEGYPEVQPGVRRRRAEPYPYLVYYQVRGDGVLILRVVHGHRHPDTWREEV